MPCYHPITAYRARNPNPSGKYPLIFHLPRSYKAEEVKIPCGQCIGCRLERSRVWAMRCVHESQLHEDNCFLTLTYDSSRFESFGRDYTLVPSDFVNFMKRFRKCYRDEKIRFFHCGEYGELNQRPHHHAIIFGFDFPDKRLHSVNHGFRIYRSPTLERLWPYGYSGIGSVTFDSCAYVARYIMKKQTGDKAEQYYDGRVPEYVTMSRRPGIAGDWILKYKDDVYNYDHVVLLGGVKCRPAKYYDRIFDEIDHDKLEEIKAKRKEESFERNKEYMQHVDQVRCAHRKSALEYYPDQSLEYLEATGKIVPWIRPLEVQEKVKLLQIKKLKRPIEGVV